MVPDCITVTVTVTTESSEGVEVGVMAFIVAVTGVSPLNVEDADAGFTELPDREPEPVIPPVAPAASMRD